MSVQTVHNMRANTKKDGEFDESVPWYYKEVSKMFSEQLTEEEIYREIYTKITTARYREALDWAKGQV